MDSCVFCQIIVGKAPATVVKEWGSVIAFVPLNPVVDGHVLIVPHRHVPDAAYAPEVTALTFEAAAEYASAPHRPDANLITSIGLDATQTVYHLHVHYIPRYEGDGIQLPWTVDHEMTILNPRPWSFGA